MPTDVRQITINHPSMLEIKFFSNEGRKDNKFQSNYFNDAFTVTEIIGTMVTIRNNQTNQIYKHHFTFIKPYQQPIIPVPSQPPKPPSNTKIKNNIHFAVPNLKTQTLKEKHLLELKDT